MGRNVFGSGGGIENDNSILEYFITHFLLNKTSISWVMIIPSVRIDTPEMTKQKLTGAD